MLQRRKSLHAILCTPEPLLGPTLSPFCPLLAPFHLSLVRTGDSHALNPVFGCFPQCPRGNLCPVFQCLWSFSHMKLELSEAPLPC